MAAAEPTLIERAPIARRLLAEYLGTGLIVAIVVGSGVAASTLSPDDVGLQLLENSFATALGLAVLIAVFASVSGAHFNPVVTAADWAFGRRSGGFPLRDVLPYVAASIGAVSGALLANMMFGVPAGIATTERVATGSLVAEVVATAGLVITIFGLVRTGRGSVVPAAVGAYIGAAYWFTSSTSFATRRSRSAACSPTRSPASARHPYCRSSWPRPSALPSERSWSSSCSPSHDGQRVPTNQRSRHWHNHRLSSIIQA